FRKGRDCDGSTVSSVSTVRLASLDVKRSTYPRAPGTFDQWMPFTDADPVTPEKARRSAVTSGAAAKVNGFASSFEVDQPVPGSSERDPPPALAHAVPSRLATAEERPSVTASRRPPAVTPERPPGT